MPMAQLNFNVMDDLIESRRTFDNFIAAPNTREVIEEAITIMAESIKNGGQVISAGNGGSMCDAMHFAEELTGRFRRDRDALPALAIADPSHLTCVANDMGYEEGFARYVKALGKPGDVLLAISTSGNSGNVIAAVEAAKERGMQVIGLTGKDGGQLKALCDVAVVVSWNGYSDRIQEIHIKIIHIWIEYIEQALFGKDNTY